MRASPLHTIPFLKPGKAGNLQVCWKKKKTPNHCPDFLRQQRQLIADESTKQSKTNKSKDASVCKMRSNASSWEKSPSIHPGYKESVESPSYERCEGENQSFFCKWQFVPVWTREGLSSTTAMTDVEFRKAEERMSNKFKYILKIYD